jgi:hypothetical protein
MDVLHFASSRTTPCRGEDACPRQRHGDLCWRKGKLLLGLPRLGLRRVAVNQTSEKISVTKRRRKPILIERYKANKKEVYILS